MAISPARRAEVIDALRRGTVPQAGLDLFAVGMERFERAIDEELDGVAAGRRRLQGGPRRVRLGQDVLRPLARRAGQAARHGRRRGADLRDRDAAAQAGDRLPPPRRAAVDRRATRRARSAQSSTPGSTRSKRTCSPTARSPPTTRGAGRGRRRAAGTAARRRRANHARVRRGAARLPAGRTVDGDQATAQAAARLARRPAQRRGRRPPRGRRQGRPRPLRARSASCRGCSRSCATPGTRACCSCSTRSRPCSGSAPTCGTRRLNALRQLDRRGRRRPVPRPVPADHRHARVLRRAAGRARLPPLAQRLATDFGTDAAVRQPARRPAPADRLRHRPSSAELGSSIRDLYAGGSRRQTADRARSSTTPTSPTSPPRSPASSAARSASRRGSSCEARRRRARPGRPVRRLRPAHALQAHSSPTELTDDRAERGRSPVPPTADDVDLDL